MKLMILRKKSIFRNLYPKSFAASAYSIDYEKLYKKGYRGIIFDIDNTLVGHDKPATEESVELAMRLKDIGFRLMIVSNNDEPRVKSFADELGIPYVFKAKKPSKDGYLKAVLLMGTTLKTTFAVGDQLITDIWGANRAGIFNIRVNPLYKEEPPKIVFKRKLEKIILFFYRHER
jgi:HAD superfamily phosphatase (TIGR01668 family)